MIDWLLFYLLHKRSITRKAKLADNSGSPCTQDEPSFSLICPLWTDSSRWAKLLPDLLTLDSLIKMSQASPWSAHSGLTHQDEPSSSPACPHWTDSSRWAKLLPGLHIMDLLIKMSQSPPRPAHTGLTHQDEPSFSPTCSPWTNSLRWAKLIEWMIDCFYLLHKRSIIRKAYLGGNSPICSP